MRFVDILAQPADQAAMVDALDHVLSALHELEQRGVPSPEFFHVVNSSGVLFGMTFLIVQFNRYGIPDDLAEVPNTPLSQEVAEDSLSDVVREDLRHHHEKHEPFGDIGHKE